MVLHLYILYTDVYFHAQTLCLSVGLYIIYYMYVWIINAVFIYNVYI